MALPVVVGSNPYIYIPLYMALLGVLAWEYGHKNNALIHGNIKIEENKQKTESSFHVYQPGFEPGSLGLRVGRSTNWAIQPLNFGDFKSLSYCTATLPTLKQL